MSKPYIIDKDFKGESYIETPLLHAEYENCTFADCLFSQSDLSDMIFSECKFENCEMSMANIKNTALRGVRFNNCKMLGWRFDECKTFGLAVSFEQCILDFSSFFGLKIPHTVFKNCSIKEVEFVETDLTKAVFQNCNLERAVFERTKLEGTDFRTAQHFTINPEMNRIQKAKFSTHNIAGLLYKYNIIIE